jgi:hypothetical protein
MLHPFFDQELLNGLLVLPLELIFSPLNHLFVTGVVLLDAYSLLFEAVFRNDLTLIAY